MKKILLVSFTIMSYFLGAQGACSKAMSNKDFKTQYKVIESAEFSETRLQLCKGILNDNCVSVKQLKEMLALFTFEAQKKEVAILAYPKVVDKENFRTIYADFKHEPNVREIEKSTQESK